MQQQACTSHQAISLHFPSNKLALLKQHAQTAQAATVPSGTDVTDPIVVSPLMRELLKLLQYRLVQMYLIQ